MLFYLGELLNWYRGLLQRRKKLRRPATALELLNEEKRAWTFSGSLRSARRDSVAADEFEAGMFPWDRRRADDE